MAFLNAEKIAPRRAVHFFKHIIKAHRYLSGKKARREEISKHIERMREVAATEKVDRFLLAQELKRLEQKMIELTEKETVIAKKQEEEDALLKKMQTTLEKLGISIIGEAKPLEEFERIGREVKEMKAETKLTEEELKAIESKLASIERKLSSLKKSKKYKTEKELILELEQKIKSHKNVIEEIKKK